MNQFLLRPTTLSNDLVELIPLEETDFDKLFAVAADPLIWEQHPTKDRYKKEVFQLFFDKAVQSKSAFIIKDKVRQELIGSTRFYDLKPEQSTVSIGYTFLARPCWGNGYNTALKKLLINHAFQYVDTILFHVGAENLRS